MYYDEKKNLGALDPITGVLGLATAATGGLFNYFGTKEAVKGQNQQAQSALQAQYSQQRAQAEQFARQAAVAGDQAQFTVEKQSHDMTYLALMGVAGVSVVIAGIFIWRATRSK